MNICNSSFKSVLETMEYVPFVSTVKNLGDIFAKAVWKPDSTVLSVHAKTYYEHIIDKSYLRCALLLIPVLGNFFVWLIDLEKETEQQAIEKDQGTYEKIKLDIRCALLNDFESLSGTGSRDNPVFNPTFSYMTQIEKKAVMKSVNGVLEIQEDLLNVQMLGIEVAIENLHRQFGKEALDCIEILGGKDSVRITFPAVPSWNLQRMLQTVSHNRPALV